MTQTICDWCGKKIIPNPFSEIVDHEAKIISGPHQWEVKVFADADLCEICTSELVRRMDALTDPPPRIGDNE